MIQFRCWFCNKGYAVPEKRAGERLTCSCKRLLRIPRQSGGNSRARTATDWLVEGLVYGGGGALLGFGLSLLIVSRVRTFGYGWMVIVACTAMGFLAGLFGGERGVNFIGRMIRDREQR
jgi:hypothetical protein